MTLKERIEGLVKWGTLIENIPSDQRENLLVRANAKNGWFISKNSSFSLSEILNWLKLDVLQQWTSNYNLNDNRSSKAVGIVMAGNIPLVGFHDLLSVLISGHSAKIKLSSQDEELLLFLLKLLKESDSRWEQYIETTDRLNNIDAVIATGSDNSSRYFEHYFQKIPRIIRKNRTSVGIIMGEEDESEFENLAEDVFSYFGLGCRNVSKLYVPEGFDLNSLKEPFQSHKEIVNHSKYGNNYDYQRAIRLISNKPFIDLDFILLEESSELVSPIAVLYYQYYNSQQELKQLISKNSNKIQCIVSAKGWLNNSIPFGTAQQPTLIDYADGIDTLKFLSQL